MAENCLKWLKTKMDRESFAVPHSLTPFRQTPVAKMPHSKKEVILLQDAYDAFPIHTQIAMMCPFCRLTHVPSYPPEQVSYFKNPYTRRSWTPMCADCSEKTLATKQ
jgi:hypothetical protein